MPNARSLSRLLSLLLPLAAGPALAADPPRYVAGPLSGLDHDCRQAGQRSPRVSALVTEIDLDGDGKPDHIVDTARSCEAVRLLYCGSAGCSVDIYLSTLAGKADSFRARQVAIDRTARPPRLVLTTGGSACGTTDAQACTITLQWTNGALAASRQPAAP